MLTNRINSVTVRNFRSLADVTVDLEDLTVLVGANGSGKSNFLEVLRFVRDVIVLGLEKALSEHRNFIGIKRQLTVHPSPTVEIEIQVKLILDGQESSYAFSFGWQESYGYALTKETANVGKYRYEVNHEPNDSMPSFMMTSSFDPGKAMLSGFPDNLSLKIASFLPEYKVFQHLYDFLTNLRIYSPFPERLRIAPIANRLQSALEDHGENFASVLFSDIQENLFNKRRQDFYEALTQIVPGIDVSRPIRVTNSDRGQFAVDVQHSDPRGWLKLDSESDGTLRVVALLIALYQTYPVSLMGIEEPELMIHPKALAVLADIIYEASQHRQIILTTHSPDLISRFKADSLRIVELVNGETKIGPIREDQRQVIEEQLFGGGDLLRLGGLARG